MRLLKKSYMVIFAVLFFSQSTLFASGDPLGTPNHSAGPVKPVFDPSLTEGASFLAGLAVDGVNSSDFRNRLSALRESRNLFRSAVEVSGISSSSGGAVSRGAFHSTNPAGVDEGAQNEASDDTRASHNQIQTDSERNRGAFFGGRDGLLKIADKGMADFVSRHDDGVNENLDVIVIDSVEFNEQLRAIYQLLNPPANLHPLLKWALYLRHVTPEMLNVYEKQMKRRNRIFSLASKSHGRLHVRYKGEVMPSPLFAWPDSPDSGGKYELVMMRSGRVPQ
jgi:hypothetical protein